jgi:Contractile injection system tube protein
MADPAKAFIKPEKGADIPCLFNPADLTISKSTQWTESKGKGKNTPKLTFQQGQSGKITLNLTLDTTTKRLGANYTAGEPVTKYTTALLALMKVDPSLKGSNKGNNSARPPWCEFHWGDFHSFKCVVESLQIKFTYFASDGTPLRAQANLTLKQYEDQEAWGAQNPTSLTLIPHAVHHVVHGETLDRIASTRYGDPSRWRLLAEANGILDPLELQPGAALSVPEVEAVSRG